MADKKHQGPVIVGPYIPYNGGVRPVSDIKLVVIHDTEGGGSAKNVAAWGATQRNASWHVVVDNDCVVRQLPDNIVAWGAPPCNDEGLQCEIVGFASWSKLQWFKNQSSLKRAAWQTARWCVGHDIPARWLTDAQLKAGAKGLTYHAQVSRVFDESDHTDPGKNFPFGYFLFLVKRRVKWLKAS
jgi:N-acetylmuramoyl-L-alanine amidase.